MAHLHSVYDADTHFIIDPSIRGITNTSDKSRLIQGDHNSERFTFEMPRYIEEHDSTLCNRVEVHYINVGANGREEGVYEIEDFATSPADMNKVIGSWLLSANATKYAGSLSFLVRFACVTDGIIEYDWHTSIFSGITIENGMNNGEAVVEEYSDILAEWEQRLFAQFETKVDKVEGATAGNFAGLDGEGNLTDSGKKPDDFAAAEHTHDYAESKHTHLVEDITDLDLSNVGGGEGKADKVAGATAGNFAGLDASGNLTDSGLSLSEVRGVLGEFANTINLKGTIIPLAYNERQLNIDAFEAAHPASESLHQYAWIDYPMYRLVTAEGNAWVEVTASPYDTYVFENRIYFYKNNRMTEVSYLRDIEAVTESVIASLPIYEGEVEAE